MPDRNRVGGRPRKTRGPEEAHRPELHRRNPAAGVIAFVSGRRFRLQAAGVVAIILVATLSLLIVRPRTISIIADGTVSVVKSRTADGATVVEQAGIELKTGDRVEVIDEDTLAVRRAAPVTLKADGRTLALRTQAETIGEVLAEASVPLDGRDTVLRNGMFVSPDDGVAASPAAETVALDVRRAVPFTLAEDGLDLQLTSSRETVATALREAGVLVGPGDRVDPPLDTELAAGTEVRIERAVPIVVTSPKDKVIVYSLEPSVGEALEAGGIDLPERYRLEPGAAERVAHGLVVHVIGISQGFETEEERIESRTVYQPDPSMPPGDRRVVAGHDGVLFRQYRTVHEDGQLVSRELVAEWYDPEPVDTVVHYSTAPPPQPPPPRDVPDGLNVVRVLRVYATWYSPASTGRSPSDPYYGITATGVPVDRGVVAVDPGVIPLGTRMFIPGYGDGVAADTGGGIRGNMIDLGYPDGVVPDWTSRWIEIYILGP